jgi:hypothetical protein
MSQGYITLATGPREYLEMAINLLLSLKHNDPTRKTCIVIDEGSVLPEEYTGIPDYVSYLHPREGFHGCLNKLRLHELSPFKETMFVDADCILVKNDMDRHWKKFGGLGFNIAGSKVTKGSWYGFAIQKVIKAIGVPYMVKMNSGVFYFTKSTETNAFFETAQRLVSTHKELLGTYHRNQLQLADEPFIGVALGVHGIEPINYSPSEGSIMITTVNCSQAVFDPIGHISRITKYDGFRLLGRFFPRETVHHSPSFAHFVKLRPPLIYQSCACALRHQFNVPLHQSN